MSRPCINSDWRIDEELEARAFPELRPEPVSPSAAMRALFNLDDTLRAIDEADLALERGCGSFERHCHLATLGGRTVEQAKAEAHLAFQLNYTAAVEAELAVA